MQFVLNELKKEKTLTLVTAPSTVLDLNLFGQLEGVVYFDDNPDLNLFPVLNGTKVILLKNNAIDSILTIEAMLISEQMDYIAHYK